MCLHGTLKDIIIAPKPFPVKIDSCIADEISWLNSQGVYTVNSCCGHGKEKPKAVIYANHGSVKTAIELGYDPRPVDMMFWEIELKSKEKFDYEVDPLDLKWIIEQAEKAEELEKTLCALLNLSSQAELDTFMDIIIDVLAGLGLSDGYHQDVIEGRKILIDRFS